MSTRDDVESDKSMKKIIVAPDSFKGTMHSIEVCDIIKNAIHSVDVSIEVVTIPIADGGEGTVDAFLSAAGGKKVNIQVKDPLMRNVEAYYGVLPDNQTAVIEMAQASGIGYVENNLQPLNATTFGTGQLIKSAMDIGCRKIVLGLGGSATTDGGVGAAAALGIRFLTKDRKEIPLNGGGLAKLYDIDTSCMDINLKHTEIIIACDVANCLCGKDGTATTFGSQKGASKSQIALLDQNLSHYADILQEKFEHDVTKIRGGGAAGGLAIPLIVFANAQIMPGIDILLETVKFKEMIQGADLIITGEGQIDSQTIFGKVPIGVARASKGRNISVVAIGGKLGCGYEAIYDEGISCIFSVVNDLVSFDVVKKTCRKDLFMLIRNLMLLINTNS